MTQAIKHPAFSFSSTRTNSNASRSIGSSANASESKFRCLQDEAESKGIWHQKEFQPGVVNLLNMCLDLWETEQQGTKDFDNSGEFLKCGVGNLMGPVTGSVDSETPVHDSMLSLELPASALSPHGSAISVPKTASPHLSTDIGSSAGWAPADPKSRSPMAEPWSDALNQRWELKDPAVNAFAHVPFYGCAGSSAVQNMQEPIVDVDSDEEAVPDDLDDAEVLVGPTHLAVKPFKLEDQALPQRFGQSGIFAVPLQSGPGCLSLSDALRLADARSGRAPLSFGSTLHLCRGHDKLCRPCMFERWVGRCTKSWLCDFCHMHVSDKKVRKGTQKISMEALPPSISDPWCWQGPRPKSL